MKEVAIKKALKSRSNPKLEKEAIVYQACGHHPNLLSMLAEYSEDFEGFVDRRRCIVLEYCPKSLYNMIRKSFEKEKPLPDESMRVTIYQLLRGLNFMHIKGYIHADVKPGNLLFNKTGRLKIADMGGALRVPAVVATTHRIVTRHYRPPEAILHKTPYGSGVDIWSVGALIFELYSGGHKLFRTRARDANDEGDRQLLDKIFQVLGTPSAQEFGQICPAGKAISIQRYDPALNAICVARKIPADVIDMIRAMLQYDPAARMTPVQALVSPVFENIRESAVSHPYLFDFSVEELAGINSHTLTQLIPASVMSNARLSE